MDNAAWAKKHQAIMSKAMAPGKVMPSFPRSLTTAVHDGQPTPEIIDPVKPVRLRDQALMEKWQNAVFKLMQSVEDSIANGKASDARSFAVAAAVGTDKVLVLAGRPTSITASLHEVRHSLPQLATMLSRVASKVFTDDTERPLPNPSSQ